jgi:hypothetical protein
MQSTFVPRPRSAVMAATAATMLVVLAGCSGLGLAVAGAGAGAAAGVGVEHSLNGVAYKTFTAPIAKVESAAQRALTRMAMTVERTEDTETGRAIFANADTREIEIELEPLTSRTTRMRVVAMQEIPILRDAATATEIIVQTAAGVDAAAAAVVPAVVPAVSLNLMPTPRPIPERKKTAYAAD